MKHLKLFLQGRTFDQLTFQARFRVCVVLAISAVLPLQGCAFLPGDGPSASEIIDSKNDPQKLQNFNVIEIDSSVIAAINKGREEEHSGAIYNTFGSVAVKESQRLDVGDTVRISIWEIAPGGLFSPPGVDSGSRAEVIPPQRVGSDGNIIVPFVGIVHAVGLSPIGLAGLIKDKLQGRANDPQVVVTVQESSSSATVVGDVTGAGKVPLITGKERIMDVISQAGGIKASPQETFVKLTRQKTVATASVSDILNHPTENVAIRPGDMIYVYKIPQTFTALGSVLHPGELRIDRPKFTLAQAIGVSGGLDATVADKGGVFIFRMEESSIYRSLKSVDTNHSETQKVPVIYRLDFKGPESYMLAQSWPVYAQDVIYVSEAPAVGLVKFLRVIHDVSVTSQPDATMSRGFQ